MNIAWGGDVVLECRRLPGRRPSRSLPRRDTGGDRRDDPWVGLLELGPGSQYRVPGDELFGRHRVWVATHNQCGRSDGRLAARYRLVETSAS
jgi:hypothetical protein